MSHPYCPTEVEEKASSILVVFMSNQLVINTPSRVANNSLIIGHTLLTFTRKFL